MQEMKCLRLSLEAPIAPRVKNQKTGGAVIRHRYNDAASASAIFQTITISWAMIFTEMQVC